MFVTKDFSRLYLVDTVRIIMVFLHAECDTSLNEI